MDSLYFLKISECPLDAWEDKFKNGYKSIRRPGINIKELERLASENRRGMPTEDAIAELDYDAWDLLYIDWEENVKQDAGFVEYKGMIKRLNDLYLKFINSKREREGVTVRDRSIMNEIRRVEAFISNYEKKLGAGQTINQTLIILSKNQGYHLKKKDLTVQEYFDLIEMNTQKPSKNG